MLKLHGRTRSNYYNAVKVILIERDIPFEEVIEPVPPTEAFLSLSPMAKIPCLVTDDGPITETTAIIDYLEASFSDNPLGGSTPYEQAKQHELAKTLELYVEWLARRGYGFLRGQDVAEADKEAIKAGLGQAIGAVSHLASFSPWICGDALTWVDFFGYFMVVYARLSAEANAGIDLLGEIPGAAEWFARVEARESMQRVLADAKG